MASAAAGLSRIDYTICYKSRFFKKQYKGNGDCFSNCAVPFGGEECDFLQEFCGDCDHLKEVYFNKV